MIRSRRCRPELQGLESRELLSLSHPIVTERTDHPGSIPPALAAPQATTVGRTIRQSDALIYLPPGLKAGATYPILVAFSPTTSFFTRTLNFWKAEANRNKWIIYSSREVTDRILRNAQYEYETLVPLVRQHIDAALREFPVDSSRIILAGFSGGAAFAHDLNIAYPGFAAAVVDNSNGAFYAGVPFDHLPPASEFSGSRRIAVFLASPSDHVFYAQVQATIPIYQHWGWQTLFLSYKGGHIPAPAARIRQAMAWLTSRPSWH